MRITMPSRFSSNLLLAIVGGAVAACSLLFAPAVVRWLALGAGCAAVAITLLAFAIRGRGLAQRLLDAPVVALGAWTIVAATTFTGATQRWTSFANAAALCALAVVGLIAHEVAIERDLQHDTDAASRAVAAREQRGRTDLRQPVPSRPDVAA
jgi:hypothetical protein